MPRLLRTMRNPSERANPCGDTMKLAALDVGTNTVLMLVAEETPDGGVRKLADLSRITRVGRGVDSIGKLDPAAAQTTLDTIADFVDQARRLGATKILSAATAALRDVADGADFIARVKARCGIDLDIISGETEAQLSYLSSVKGLKLDPSAKLLIVDIGGGSTELVRAQPGGAIDAVSLQIGSVRLTERYVHSDPPHPREAADLRLAIDGALEGLRWNFAPDLMVGIAGTVTTIAAVALGLAQYDPDRVHGYQLTEAEVLRTIGLFGCVGLEDRKRLPGLEAGRADVIFAGAAILERMMAHFKIDRVTVSDQGVRWGLVWREIERPSTT
jgi:exopolyphosphatase/guanosine-5'-triphosphate,3'-diphosphate pyrophosphatase